MKFSRRHSSSSTCSVTFHPIFPKLGNPFPATRGLGSPEPTTTRAIPASRMAWVQGGCRPWWQQGSRVTYRTAPAGDSVQPARASRSAWAWPHRWCHPRPITRPSFTITAPPWGWERSIPSPAPPAPGPVSCSLNRSNTRLPTKKRLEGKPSRRSMAGRRAIESPVKQKTLKRRTISEHTRITGHAISPETQIFFHPDYTVGFGIAPNPAPERSRTIPPIGNFTLP